MKLYKKVHHPSPIAGSYDYDTYEPVEITEDNWEELCFDNFGKGPRGIAKAITKLLQS